jgi:hypothetical protein
MANMPDDLRNNVGKAGAPDSTPAPLIGGRPGIPLPETDEHSVKPIAGDNGGVADGQVTKSN